MGNFIDFLFNTSYWPPRWHCGHWTEALGYTHIISDVLIFLAYFAIPCILLYFYYKIKGFELERIFGLFALFIVFCGTGHLIEAVIFYYPVYRFAGLVKALTAIVSWITVFALVPYIKKLSLMPQLKLTNKELTEKLEVEQKRLKLAFEGTSAGLWEWDFENHTCKYTNKFMELLGFGPSEEPEEDSSFYNLIHPDELGLLKNSLKSQVEKGKPLKLEARLKMKNGNYRWFLVHGKAEETPGTHLRRFVGSISDIHEAVNSRKEKEDLCNLLKNYNEELKEKQETLEDFSYHVAHDLKEPVRGMGSYATILLEDDSYSISEPVREKLQKIVTLSSRSLQMIDNMLEYCINDKGKTLKDVLDIEPLLNELMEEIHDPPNKISLKIVGELPRVYAEAVSLKEVLRNLISNGFKYNDNVEKIVEIGCTDTNDCYEFYVRDNGQGIIRNDQDKVFDLFYRGINAKKESSSGLGLGIAKKYIEKNGGKIWLSSEVGKGSTFYFTIPKTEMQ